MPFNVVDNKGNHLGIVVKSYPNDYNLFLIAVTDKTIDEVDIDLDSLKQNVATTLECKTLLGKVNEEKLTDKLNMELKNTYSDLEVRDIDVLMKYIFLKQPYTKTTDNIEKTLGVSLQDLNEKGYLLQDRSKINLKGDRIVIEDEVDYIKDSIIANEKPIFAKVVDYPIHQTSAMSLGEGLILGANLSDFGGRNHSHKTVISIYSGNYKKENYEIPAPINVKKGMPVQIYLEKDKIKYFVCDEVIYQTK
ncbi:hypothetical protein RH915_07405 [Serpentinicella sp. ANB-PHB4]|uniref:hypothetical protein n=1 Tax=Serpentinicella sp. ANB-PHB4 TaxID=3074076 RepID=UPI002862CE67|nr:hypothetical protein [Serpentinicella sp. ANB-PHB4]MDR5659313.1 hypothetical protein [Serpentinicella sp. ANB-PHB4]